MKIKLTQEETKFDIGDRVLVNKPTLPTFTGQINKILIRVEPIRNELISEDGEKLIVIVVDYHIMPDPEFNLYKAVEAKEFMLSSIGK